MRKTSLAVLAASTFLIQGCSLIPDYTRPDLPVASSWPTGPGYDAGKAGSGEKGKTATAAPLAVADIGWRDYFRSPHLQTLIGKALANNRDLRVAILNIEKARAQYGIERASLYPQLNAGASGSRARTPAQLSSTGSATVKTEYTANLSTSSWELDFFGRVHSLTEQALEQYLATEDAKLSTQTTLISEVATDYLALLADRQLLDLTRATLDTYEQTYALTERRFQHGISSQQDVAQARGQVESARASLAQYTRQVAQDRNALELVVGAPLTDADFDPKPDFTAFITDLPAGLPSDLLARRPDIREAEHTLKAANANIGAARAAFFPKITLTGSGGYESVGLNNLFQGASGAWSFGPTLSVPIFDAGYNEANLASAKADRDIYVADYEKTIQTAFKEVADALTARKTWDQQISAQTGQVDANQDYYRLSLTRYQHGTDDFLTVLDSQRTLFTSQQTLISDQLSRLSNLVTLYQVLGGGVVERTGDTPAPTEPAATGNETSQGDHAAG